MGAAWNGVPVLVTGGAGFVGSHLVEALVARGARVWVLDVLEDPIRLRGVRDRIQYVTADLAQWRDAPPAAFEIVFHLAAFSNPSAAQEQPDLAYRQNVLGTVNMLQMARQCPLRKFVFLSAGALYTNVPAYLPIDEAHPIDPGQSVYAMTKRVGELVCEDFHRTCGVPYVYFRLFNTYGPRQSMEYLIPSFIGQALADGRITVLNGTIQRDFSYVADIVGALIKGAEGDYCGGPLNLGTGIEHSIEDVARKIGALVGVPVHCQKREVFGPTRQVCDSTRARQVLGWRPVYSLDEGLRLTLRAFREETLDPE